MAAHMPLPDGFDPKHTVVVATGNMHKLTEIEAILSEVLPGVRFIAWGQLAAHNEPEETGASFEENALIKARACVAATGLPSIADDSGLVVDALDGAPGVYSARYAGVHGDDVANNARLLSALEAVPDEERNARFMSVVAYVEPEIAQSAAEASKPDKELAAASDVDSANMPYLEASAEINGQMSSGNPAILLGCGTCEGRIARALRGDFGFGYDPLFLPQARPGKSMAELSPSEKNAISHRFFALKDLAHKLHEHMQSKAGRF
ncbi:non-canonical purine NTP pyrophosphatase [Collinsella sp. zg1085]|uniref:non-canonical purine NTP pyrophosphatase n=1 Tax=Collinsella sp. zg1085 TaxID=2844380 RepID=UPI001C0AC94F|nr:non-canonical purine NTP pyrophosphatase [Collinsella sp. zg1085]QWT17913.1 non-canonical purine NTP pyrophosphatase [Collinsella sp. zg1085]